jgi:hypothetical protein
MPPPDPRMMSGPQDVGPQGSNHALLHNLAQQQRLRMAALQGAYSMMPAENGQSGPPATAGLVKPALGVEHQPFENDLMPGADSVPSSMGIVTSTIPLTNRNWVQVMDLEGKTFYVQQA